MKKFAFVSDFDGTLTQKDFYHIIKDKYLGQKGQELYLDWKKNRKINVDFLNLVFSSANLTEDKLYEEIKKIPFDKTAIKLINKIKSQGGDFYIVSAGTSYYINILLKHLNIDDVKVISMEGEPVEGGFRIIPDKASEYYSELFGIDKRRVIENIKKEYEHVFFAGDSEPDFEASKVAEIRFARSELQCLLDRENLSYIHYSDFNTIDRFLTENGWLNEETNS